MMEIFSVIGKRLPKVDSREMVTGEAKYLADIKLPIMLSGKVLRSPYPHARILAIDISEAERLPGVKAVITAKECPKVKFCIFPELADKLPLADEKVRYIGDEVAAVAAEDDMIALEALSLIKVEYDELPSLLDPLASMEPGAPRIHDRENNTASSIRREFGDVEKGFKESDFIFEDRFFSQPVAHCALEPRGCLAHLDISGKLTIWSTTQSPHLLRQQLAQVLLMPLSKIRVIKTKGGGCFGSRMDMDSIDPICALLAKKSGRPVRIINTREEEFMTGRVRYPMIIDLKAGVKKDGTLIARQARVVTDNGAYNNHGASITGNCGSKLAQLYSIPHIKFEAFVVYTNNQYGGPFRGYGNPQITFAMESQMDMIAERLGMDTVKIRLKNANRSGDITASECRIVSCGLAECICRAAEEAHWEEKREKSKNRGIPPINMMRGIGMAVVIHGGSGVKFFFGKNCNLSQAILKFNLDGTVDLLTGESDLGQGSDTVLAQIVAEELGLSLNDINLIVADTDVTPLSLGSWGSRVTFVAGNAVREAALDAKRQLLEMAAEMLEAHTDDLEVRDRKISIKGFPGKALSIAEVVSASFRIKGRPIISTGHFDDPISVMPDMKTGLGNVSSAYSFAAQVAEVEVDTETGQVKVLNFVCAHDLGRAINPMAAEGQIEGAVAQGVGYTLVEGLAWDRGKTLNKDFTDYKIFRSLDMPKVTSILVETIDPYGPFGAKGLGELGLVPTAPAIANAIYDAVGIRIKDLPMTSEKILKAIKSLSGKKGRDSVPALGRSDTAALTKSISRGYEY